MAEGPLTNPWDKTTGQERRSYHLKRAASLRFDLSRGYLSQGSATGKIGAISAIEAVKRRVEIHSVADRRFEGSAVASFTADTLRDDSQEEERFFLSTLRPGLAQNRIAIAVVLILVTGFLFAAGPLASLRVPRIDAFIPSYATAMFLNDAITGALLIGQFLVLRSRALLAIACAYLFAAFMMIPWAASLPGVLSSEGSGTMLQSPTSFYILRHIGFPLLVISYVMLKDAKGAAAISGKPGIETLLSVVLIAALVAALAYVVIAEDARLPQFMVDGVQPSGHLADYLLSTGILTFVALLMLWRHRYSVLDLWLAVVLCAYLIEILLISFPVPNRFSMGWYTGRIYGWIASTVVLIAFLYEVNALYIQTIRAMAGQKRIAQDLRRVRDDLQAEVNQRRESEEQVNQLNEQLGRQASQLQEANKELEAFAYSVSHDLRAPLRQILGFSELLQKHSAADLNERGQRYVRTIEESAKRMGALIDDLLGFSRVGRAEAKWTITSLDQLVREAISELAGETGAREIVWKIGKLPSCYGDRSMLKLALQNLIANAIKFTRTRPRAEIEIGSVAGRPDETVVFVRDNGVGFDMRYADKLFGVFQRLHPASEFEGTGVGLATVQRIIHRHGGHVRAEGEPDRGATFYVSLPRSKGAA